MNQVAGKLNNLRKGLPRRTQADKLLKQAEALESEAYYSNLVKNMPSALPEATPRG